MERVGTADAGGSAAPALGGGHDGEAAPPPPAGRASLARPMALGFGAAGAALLGLAGLSLWGPLASAAVAPGTVVVEFNRRVVQHPEGGVVARIHARDGDWVEAGRPLLALETKRVDAALDSLRAQLTAALARRARLEAEAAVADALARAPAGAGAARAAALAPDFAGPGEAGVRAADHPAVVTDQRLVFESRRAALLARVALAEAEVAQAEAAVAAIDRQLTAHAARAGIARQQLGAQAELARRGVAPELSVPTARRAVSDVEADEGRVLQSRAEAEGRAAVGRARAAEEIARFREAAAEGLQQVAAALPEIRERLAVEAERAARAEIRAPVAGLVLNSLVHTEGGVVGAGAPLMQVVPAERLLVEARVRVEDVGRVAAGQRVDIRVPGVDGGLRPRLVGRVERVSADRLVGAGRDGAPAHYFEARVEVLGPVGAAGPVGVAPADLGGLRLRPGMSVDVLVPRQERTAIEELASVLAALLAGRRAPP